MSLISLNGRFWARVLLVLVFIAVGFLGVSIIASATHQNNTLDVPDDAAEGGNQETQIATVGSRVFVTAKISPPANSHGINTDWEHKSGPAQNDPGNDGDVGTAPDFSCTILPGPTPSPSPSPSPTESPDAVSTNPTECTMSYIGEVAGTDQWRAWVDRDGLDSNDESDKTEARQEDESSSLPSPVGPNGQGCGSPTVPSGTEPDCTDVFQVTWTAATVARIDCDDQSGDDRETNPSGGAASSERYTCRLQDENGNSVNNTVRGEVKNGINDPDDTDGASYQTPDYACTAVSGGVCEITVNQSEGEIGTAQICFWVEQPGQEGPELCNAEATAEFENNDLADQVEKTWTMQTGSPSPQTGSPGTAPPPGSPTGSPTATQTGTRPPSPPPDGADRSITLAASRGRIGAGRPVTLAGQVSSSDQDCVRNQTVQITRRRHGSTQSETVGTAGSGDDGSYSLDISPKRNAEYLASLPEVPGQCDAAMSNTTNVLVKVKATATAKPKRPRRGRRVAIACRVTPNQRGTRARLQQKRRGGFATVDQDRLNRRSRCDFTRRARWQRSRVFRVVWPKQGQRNEKGTSGKLRIRTR